MKSMNPERVGSRPFSAVAPFEFQKTSTPAAEPAFGSISGLLYRDDFSSQCEGGGLAVGDLHRSANNTNNF